LHRLAGYARPVRWFDGRYYASAPVDKHFEGHEQRSLGFRRWLIRLHHVAMHRPASDAAIKNVIAALESQSDLWALTEPVLLLAVLVFAAQNRDTVGVSFLVWSLSISEVFLILGTYVLGMLSGWVWSNS
jgi:uncharacterized integral membrane protein